jgi:mono/diheme cytochrome c family protein
MMDKKWTFQNWFLIVFAPVLFICYTNCGDMSAGGRDGAAQLASLGGNCDETLLNHYKTVVYPFFRQPTTCISCHIEGGPGLGTFASVDPDASFAAFSGAGLTKIQYMATNPAHKPPYTGVQNKPAMDAIVASWLAYQNEYLQCVAKTQNGGLDESMLTASKKAPKIYSGPTVTQTLTWELDLATDLDDSVKRSIPAKISVDIKVLYQTIDGKQVAKGYIFSNPVMQLKSDSVQIVIEGLFFQINGVPITSQTTFTSLSRVVGGTTATPLMKAQANTLIEPLSTQDDFQLYIRRIVPTAGNDESPAPLTPIISLADASTGSDQYSTAADTSVIILRDAGIVRWCLSESPTKPVSTEAPCQNSVMGAGTSNGWSLARPTKFTFGAGDGAKKLYLWVANENLKINDSPGTVSITLDTTAPAAPTIGGITVSDTQVATMALSHPAEADVTGWCVFEQNSIKAAPAKPKLNNVCWSWSDAGVKPTTVGFKDGGSRDVYVFVRDKAGNISAASNKQTAMNSFGAITYAQLTAAGSGARAIFANRCLTCHGQSSGPGFSKLQLSMYSAAVDVAQSGLMVSRINNVTSPMPNVAGGLMPQRERDLLKLWTLPEEGNTPLP